MGWAEGQVASPLDHGRIARGAKRRLRSLEGPVVAHLNGYGEGDRALDWLERAYEERQVQAMFVAVEPVFAPLRAAPRFGRLCRRMGLRVS